MLRNVLSKGKTVKDAVEAALDLLNASKLEVDIEILEKESNGILRFGAKPAVVRVTLKEEKTESPESPEQMMNKLLAQVETSIKPAAVPLPENPVDLSGKIWIRDGQISCKDAADKYPMVSPGNGITLFKNEEQVEKTVMISENDILRVEIQDEERKPQWELTLTQDKMKAILKVIPGFSIFRRLKDKKPAPFVQLEVEEKKMPYIIDTAPLMDHLKEWGIVDGIDYGELARACTTDTAGSFVIAQGRPPKPGKHGYFRPIKEIEIKKGLKEREDGTVDYREIQEFPSVELGQIIGVIMPPVQGIPGSTVTNEPVAAPESMPLIVQAGNGVTLVEGDSKVVAIQAGHPDFKQTGQIATVSVTPKLLIGKDIDLQTGNVHYFGSVEIMGNVQDGMLVEAQGDIMIRKNAHTAKVLSGSSIIVQNNIIASELAAGKSSILKAEIAQLLTGIIEIIKQMASATTQLTAVAAFKTASLSRTGLGPLIKILCEGKFKTFPPLKTALLQKIKDGAAELGKEWLEFHERLDKGFHPTLPSHLHSMEDFNRFIQTSEQLLASILETEQDKGFFISAGFAHNSQLYSSGDISLHGQGSYNSKLHAEGNVEVTGYVRGGEIYGGASVAIGEAGTRGGISSKISVPKHGTIRMNRALEDTIIQVGGKEHKFLVEAVNVFARLNEYGELILS